MTVSRTCMSQICGRTLAFGFPSKNAFTKAPQKTFALFIDDTRAAIRSIAIWVMEDLKTSARKRESRWVGGHGLPMRGISITMATPTCTSRTVTFLDQNLLAAPTVTFP